MREKQQMGVWCWGCRADILQPKRRAARMHVRTTTMALHRTAPLVKPYFSSLLVTPAAKRVTDLST